MRKTSQWTSLVSQPKMSMKKSNRIRSPLQNLCLSNNTRRSHHLAATSPHHHPHLSPIICHPGSPSFHQSFHRSFHSLCNLSSTTCPKFNPRKKRTTVDVASVSLCDSSLPFPLPFP